MVLGKCVDLSDLFSIHDFCITKKVHTVGEKYVQAMVLGRNVEIPYYDAKVFLLNRGVSIEKETRNLPTERRYIKGRNDAHLPIVRLGGLATALKGKEMRKAAVSTHNTNLHDTKEASKEQAPLDHKNNAKNRLRSRKKRNRKRK